MVSQDILVIPVTPDILVILVQPDLLIYIQLLYLSEQVLDNLIKILVVSLLVGTLVIQGRIQEL